ncbi:PaaI family thioesterase [Lentibacillus jeotgali]|uniref:PaaI family thioesterase n=1 Tax=Lentibacillus jeotgali TaxID=558169 RepID=UPI0002628BC7|nr:PaaI family thioesterase [Lentibacillus jeotgali]
MDKLIEDVRNSFESSPFFSHVGFEIIEFEEGNVILKLPIRKQLLNANDSLHGGVHATMLDLVLGMAIRSMTRTRCTTISLNINYLNPSTEGEIIYATGNILKQGYRMVVAEGEIKDENDNILAKGMGNYKLIRD